MPSPVLMYRPPPHARWVGKRTTSEAARTGDGLVQPPRNCTAHHRDLSLAFPGPVSEALDLRLPSRESAPLAPCPLHAIPSQAEIWDRRVYVKIALAAPCLRVIQPLLA